MLLEITMRVMQKCVAFLSLKHVFAVILEFRQIIETRSEVFQLFLMNDFSRKNKCAISN